MQEDAMALLDEVLPSGVPLSRREAANKEEGKSMTRKTNIMAGTGKRMSSW